MSKEIKRQLKSAFLASIMTISMASTKLPKVKAEDAIYDETLNKVKESINNAKSIKYEEGTIVDIEGIYKLYVVKKNDNLSKISKKICKYYGSEATTKYWPVLAFLNGFPRVINPGDIIVFLNSIEDMELLWTKLKEQGWISKYIQKNNIYKAQSTEPEIIVSTVKELVYAIYGFYSDELVYTYLKKQGLTEKYDADTLVDTTNKLFELTEWVPTLQELGYIVIENKGGNKILVNDIKR